MKNRLLPTLVIAIMAMFALSAGCIGNDIYTSSLTMSDFETGKMIELRHHNYDDFLSDKYVGKPTLIFGSIEQVIYEDNTKTKCMLRVQSTFAYKDVVIYYNGKEGRISEGRYGNF